MIGVRDSCGPGSTSLRTASSATTALGELGPASTSLGSKKSLESTELVPATTKSLEFTPEQDKKQDEKTTTSSVNPYTSDTTFESLGLHQQLYNNLLCEFKFSTPSKIQAQTIPIVLKPSFPNFIGQAAAGSGKTIAYGLSIMARALNAKPSGVFALVLVPTRELAVQVHGVLSLLAKNTTITIGKAVTTDRTPGVKPITTSTTSMGTVIVGTPGTLVNKFKYREIDGSQIRMLVVDEADVMLSSQGLGDQSMQIRAKCTSSTQLQVLLFSATYPPHVDKFAAAIAGKSAERIQIKKEEISLEKVKQFWVETKEGDTADKYKKLIIMYGLMQLGQSIIFCESIKNAKQLSQDLQREGYSVSLLHGKDLKPSERDAIMRAFENGQTTVLIATNVLARGIDVKAVNLVINYDIPVTSMCKDGKWITKPDYETYCHRIGRAGRFGRMGAAINFVAGNQQKEHLAQIAHFFNKPIIELNFDDYVKLDKTIREALLLP